MKETVKAEWTSAAVERGQPPYLLAYHLLFNMRAYCEAVCPFVVFSKEIFQEN